MPNFWQGTTHKIEGANQLAKLSRELKTMGDKTLRRELSKGLNRATKRSKDAVRARARRDLPHRGGLAERVARSRITTRNKTTGRGNPMLQIVATNPDNIRRIDKGEVRHPVYGHKNRWVTQPVKAGWWSEPMKENQREARRELAAALIVVQHSLENARLR